MLAVRRRVDGRTDPATRAAATNLASVLNLQGQPAEAAALYCENLAATLADEQEHGITLADKANLTTALSDMGEHAEAEALLRGVWATNERLHGPGDARTRTTTAQLGCALQEQGKHTEAVADFRPKLAARRRVLGPDRPDTLRTTHNLAGALAQLPVGPARRGGGALPVRAGGAALRTRAGAQEDAEHYWRISRRPGHPGRPGTAR